MANNYTPRRAAPSGDLAPRRSTSRDTGYPSSSSRSYAPRETHYNPDNRPSAPTDSRYSSQNRPVRTTRPAPRQEEEDLYIRRRPVQTRRKRKKSGPPLLGQSRLFHYFSHSADRKYQSRNSSAISCILLTTGTPKGHRLSQPPQATQSAAFAESPW